MALSRSCIRALETKRAAIPPPITDNSGQIEGYASLFGVRDTGGDIVMHGAFMRSLRRRGVRGVKMLWQHRAEEPIGIWTSLTEDLRGLKVTGRLDMKVARAREALSLLRGGAVDGLSIGFRALRAQNEKALGGRRLLELDLWEISIVTFPMLTQARVTGVKRQKSGSADTIQTDLSLKRARATARGAAQSFSAMLTACDAGARSTAFVSPSQQD
jgi:HK97 family phage prohead protease